MAKACLLKVIFESSFVGFMDCKLLKICECRLKDDTGT